MKGKIKKKISIKKVGKLDITIFFEIIVIFGIALLSFFPGLLTSDNVDQIRQASTSSYRASHPIIHSFLIGNLTKLGGIWVPALFQIIIFALIWTYTCKKLRKYNSSVSNKIFQIIFTACICLIPLNFTYTITLWKDILYSYAILLSLILIFIGCKEKFYYTWGQIILISLSCVSIMKFRYNGVPIGIFVFGILLILNLAKQRKIKQTSIFITSFVAFFVIMSIPHWVFSPKSSGATVNSSTFRATRVYCMGKLLNSNIELEDDERNFLNSILDIDVWRESYDPYTGLYIIYNSKIDNSVLNDPDNEKKFNEIFNKYARQRKQQVIEHFISLNSIWWSKKELCYTNTLITDNFYVSEMSNGIYDTKPIFNLGNKKLSTLTAKTLNNRQVHELLYRPIVYMIISIIVIFTVMVKERKFSYIYILFPMFMNTGTYIVLMVAQDLRYFYPTFLTGYFSILVAATMFFREKKDGKILVKNNNDNPKVLIVVPAYNEELNIKNTIQDIINNTNYDYIVINDCSKDKTEAKCIEEKFNVLTLPINYGLTSGIQIGMKYAEKNNYDVVIQFDGDGQHNAKYLKRIVDYMCENKCDIVIGSRFVNRKKPFSARMIGSRVISFAIKLVTGKKISDPTSGMRAYNKKAIKEFCENASLTPEPDTIVYMLKKGYKVEEIQVEMSERKFGESYLNPIKSIKYMLNMVISIFIIRSVG